MNSVQKRFTMFLFGCVFFRLGLAYSVKTMNIETLPQLSIIGLILCLNWFRIYFMHPRNTGPEVFGGEIWWDHLRPVHAIMHGLFGVMAYKKSKYAYIPLVIDVGIGLGSFLNYHYQEGNFGKVCLY